jgi:hypothetical protein
MGIAVNGQDRVTLTEMTGNTVLPDYYFPYDCWGFKG